MNRDALYYLERFDAFEIMETHIMDHVMQEYWQSDLDASGDYTGASTSIGILNNYNSTSQFDYERQNRFNQPRCANERVKPHRFNFLVVRKSMQMRYNFEMAYVFMCAVLFQYTLYQYTSSYWLNKTAFDAYNFLVQ